MSLRNIMELSLVTFNCYGLKSSMSYVKSLYENNDIVFLFEHWLNQNEIAALNKDLKRDGYWTSLTSSMDPEIVKAGRPFGGTGFICKKQDRFSFKRIDSDSDRLSVIKFFREKNLS